MNGHDFMGRNIVVNEARPPREGGGGGGASPEAVAVVGGDLAVDVVAVAVAVGGAGVAVAGIGTAVIEVVAEIVAGNLQDNQIVLANRESASTAPCFCLT